MITKTKWGFVVYFTTLICNNTRYTKGCSKGFRNFSGKFRLQQLGNHLVWQNKMSDTEHQFITFVSQGGLIEVENLIYSNGMVTNKAENACHLDLI